MPIKLLAIDLDETTLWHNKVVSKNIYSLKKASNKGIKIVVATGRGYERIGSFLNDLELNDINDYSICYNGAFIYNNNSNKIIFKKLIDKSIAKDVLKIARNYKINFFAVDDQYVNAYYFNKWNLALKFLMNKYKSLFFKKYDEKAFNSNISKISIGGSKKNIEKFKNVVLKKYDLVFHLSLFFPNVSLWDISNKEADKYHSIRLLADQFKIKDSEIMAIGNGYNDLMMIKNAGIGIAVKNAYEELKQAADYVTLHCKDGGVAFAIDKFILRNEKLEINNIIKKKLKNKNIKNHSKFVFQSRNVTKDYDGNVILRSIDLNIKAGEFVTFLGPSGCGKTTFLRIIAGLEKQNSGDILIDGKIVNKLPAYERPINTIFQNYALFPHMNVFDNIAYGLKVKKVPYYLIKAEVEKYLDLVNLNNFELKKINQLSGGQKQRVAIARALINKPKILLLDEPMSALDKKLRLNMQMNLKKIQKEIGITFIFVTHNQEEALLLSDTIVVLNDGIIQQVGIPEEIYNEPINSWVAQFIGNSNIIENGFIIKDNLVSFDNQNFECIATNFGINEHSVDFLIRPEDIIITKKDDGFINGKVISTVFKGNIWEIKVKTSNRIFLIESINENFNINDIVGIIWNKDAIHVMWKGIDE